MVQKFPKLAYRKWERFDKLEKIFIIYCFVTSVSFFVVPIFSYGSNLEYTITFSIIEFLHINILLFSLFVFLIGFNSSYRIKKSICNVLWIWKNDALVNFVLLFSISSILVSVGQVVTYFQNNFDSTIELRWGFYFLWLLLVLGLLLNMFLALNISRKKNKKQVINITSRKSGKDITNDIKSLFNNK